MTTIFSGPTVFAQELDPTRQRKRSAEVESAAMPQQTAAPDPSRRLAVPSPAGGFTRAHPTAPPDARPSMRGSTRTRKRSQLLALSGSSDALPGEQPHMRTITSYLNNHFLNQSVSVLTLAGRVYGTLRDVTRDAITLVDDREGEHRLPLSSILSIGPKA